MTARGTDVLGGWAHKFRSRADPSRFGVEIQLFGMDGNFKIKENCGKG